MGHRKFRKSQSTGCRNMDKAEQIFKRYERRAKGKNRTFRITPEEFSRLIRDRCSYCGLYGDEEHGWCNTLDRIDGRIGYLPNNVVPACIECNFARKVMTREAFIRMCERVAKYQQELRKQKSAEIVLPEAA